MKTDQSRYSDTFTWQSNQPTKPSAMYISLLFLTSVLSPLVLDDLQPSTSWKFDFFSLPSNTSVNPIVDADTNL